MDFGYALATALGLAGIAVSANPPRNLGGPALSALCWAAAGIVLIVQVVPAPPWQLSAIAVGFVVTGWWLVRLARHTADRPAAEHLAVKPTFSHRIVVSEWAASHTKSETAVWLQLIRPLGDPAAVFQCVVMFGPNEERYEYRVPKSVTQRHEYVADFPTDFGGSGRQIPMRSGTFTYTWAADYGTPEAPQIRSVASGQFTWP